MHNKSNLKRRFENCYKKHFFSCVSTSNITYYLPTHLSFHKNIEISHRETAWESLNSGHQGQWLVGWENSGTSNSSFWLALESQQPGLCFLTKELEDPALEKLKKDILIVSGLPLRMICWSKKSWSMNKLNYLTKLVSVFKQEHEKTSKNSQTLRKSPTETKNRE